MRGDLSAYPSLNRIVARLLEIWPDHETYATASFAGRPPDVLEVCEQISTQILRLTEGVPGGLDELCQDYRYLCVDLVLPEELHFRRYNRYRLSSFEDANRECYSNAAMMNRYMNGLLLSYVMWDNHARAVSYYVNTYIASLPKAADFLEVGPGHGLFLHVAARNPGLNSITGWDISPTSIANTRNALNLMGVTRPVHLVLRNLFDSSPDDNAQKFDSVVLSEILEHLEDPVAALRSAAGWLRPGGTVWVNVPANSPAPDHLFLVHSPEHACELVESAGLVVTDSAAYPMRGVALEKARKQKLAISCIVTGRRAA